MKEFKYTGATLGVIPWSDYERIKAELEAELEAELKALEAEVQATKDTIKELTNEESTHVRNR
jgi:cell division protein FtsB